MVWRPLDKPPGGWLVGVAHTRVEPDFFTLLRGSGVPLFDTACAPAANAGCPATKPLH